MKNLFKICFIFLSISFCSHTFAKWDYKKVQSVNECSECHEGEVEVWKETKHFKTFKKFSQNKDAKKIARIMGVKRIKKATTICTSCHYTVGVKRGKKKVISGISCESCHAPSADWIDLHSDYGGKGIKKNQESAAHKKQRFADMEKHGMNRPANIYGWAKNCYNCHIVAREKLVNKGGHKAGSDFKLFKRTQDKILHTDKATGKKAKLIKLIGYAVELEMSLRAVGEASGGNKYSDKMIKRAKDALSNLKKANGAVNKAEISTVIAMTKSASIKAGNASALNSISDAISVAARITVEDEMGYRYASLDRSALGNVKVASTPAVVKSTPKPTPAPVKQTPAKPTTPIPAVQVAKISPPASVVQTKVQTRHFSKANLISSFELLSPQSSSLCNTLSPWILGEKNVRGNDSLNDESCLGLSLVPTNDGWLYLFAETKNGSLRKLLPNSCNALSFGNNLVRRGNTASLPLDKNSQESVLNLNNYPDVTGFYAIIVDTDNAKNIVDQQTGNIGDVCNDSTSQGDLQETIAQLINQTEGHLDWEYRRFYRE